MRRSAHPPIHPGEVPREEFLRPMELTQYRVAKDLRVPIPRINAIVNEKRAITADTALRLARYFGTSEGFWMNLQVNYELAVKREQLGSSLDLEIPVLARDRVAE